MHTPEPLLPAVAVDAVHRVLEVAPTVLFEARGLWHHQDVRGGIELHRDLGIVRARPTASFDALPRPVALQKPADGSSGIRLTGRTSTALSGLVRQLVCIEALSFLPECEKGAREFSGDDDLGDLGREPAPDQTQVAALEGLGARGR
jgi:hypothetical protein